MAEVRLGGLAVIMPAADSAAEGRADRHRDGELAPGSIAHLCGLRDDLVESGINEVQELDLGHGPQAIERHPDRGPDDAAFGERRIEDAVPELVEQAFRAPEHAAAAADVLPEHDDAVVRPHLLPEGCVALLYHRHRGD